MHALFYLKKKKRIKKVKELGPKGVGIKRDFILRIIRIYRSLIMINQK